MAKEQLPHEWYGTRTAIRMSLPCGICNPEIKRIGQPDEESNCDSCQHEIAWYDKLWICGCECNNDYVPTQLTVERPIPTKKEKTNDKPRIARPSKTQHDTPVRVSSDGDGSDDTPSGGDEDGIVLPGRLSDDDSGDPETPTEHDE